MRDLATAILEQTFTDRSAFLCLMETQQVPHQTYFSILDTKSYIPICEIQEILLVKGKLICHLAPTLRSPLALSYWCS